MRLHRGPAAGDFTPMRHVRLSRNRKSRFHEPHRSSWGGNLFLVLFFSVFAVMGSAFFVFMLRDIRKDVQISRTWTQAECVILDKQLRHNRDSDGHGTYAPEFQFRYEFEGQTHTVTGYEIIKLSSSQRWATGILNNFAVGQTYPCWVNPDNPSEAVLAHGNRLRYLFILIPILFILIGVGGVVYGIGSLFRKNTFAVSANSALLESIGAAQEHFPPPAAFEPGQILAIRILPAHTLERRPFYILAFFALFAGIGGWVLSIATASRQLPPLLFGLLFLLIGLLFLVLLARSILRMLKIPVARLELDAEPLVPGQSAHLCLLQDGDFSIEHATLTLICEEKAISRRGKNSTTSTKIVHEQLLAQSGLAEARPGRPFSIHAQLQLPHDAMHSFKARSNTILWRVQLQISIPGLPDVKDTFPVRVAP